MPKDIWLAQNIKTALDEVIDERNRRIKQSEIPGASEAETFSLNNPETDMSVHKTLSEQKVQRNEDLFAEKKVKTENEPINTNTFKRGDIVQPKANGGLPAERYSGRIQGVNIEGNIIVNGKTFSPERFELASENKEAENNKIEDFGEKLGGARKDRSESFKKEYTDADIASLPLSKIWPKNEVDVIEDKFVAAFAASARSEIPTKPQLRGKVLRWVEKVKSFRGMMTDLFNDIESGKYSREKILDKAKAFPSLKGFFAKVRLLEAIDREQWDRIGAVQEHPDAHRFSDKMNDTGGYDHIPAPSVSVYIDGRYRSFEGMKTVEEAISKINEYLDKAAPTKTDSIKSFEVRGSGELYFINKKGDSQYHRLKEFKTSKEALDYRNEHSEELWKAWDAVKELENVTKEDVRNKENRPRTGKDHRGGKDVTPEQFTETFGFRGVEFGNWVAQGKNTKERQGMLNESYDAIMDLANIVGIPPKAISLNGTLGLGFGSRGVGLFSAHFEPDTIVINLTKTRGAGNFAHEWFHALDNYFQRQRDVGESRESQFITYNPETYYQDKGGARLSETRYNEILERGRIHNPANWTKIEGVRPEIAEAFKRLVDVLNKSPMSERVSQIKNDYWSRIIERAARSFENYVIVKMSKQGYQNDYLANVVRLEDFKRMEGRYPYLFDDEIAPVEDAFDNLFSTIKTRETDKGVEMYSIGQRFRETAIPVDDVEPKFLDVKRANSEIITLAAEEYKSWPEKITAADDSEILLANPEDGYISKRALHLIWDNDKDQIHIEKARWLPNVPETLKNAAVRLVDQQSGNRIYVRAYNNVKHMVVVAPDGNVIEQESFKGSLVTQFPYLRPGRQESMIVDWERNGLGRSQGNPNPTPPASTIPESRQGEFQEQNTLSRKNVKDKYSTDDRGYALPMPTLEDIKKAFPGQKIIKTYAGIIIKTRAGKTVLIRGVDYIDVDSFALKIGYNKEQLSKKDVLGEEEVAVGRYKNGVIDLLRGEANRITLSHESVHWMEDIGVLDSRDVAALRGHIKRLVRKKEFEPIKKDDIGGSEDRARFLAEVLNAEEVPKGFVGRIVARIQDFIDGIVNAFGLRTVKGIVRDIKSGEIFKKEGTEKGQTEQYSIRQSRPESEETHGMLKKKWDEFRYQVQDRFRYLEKEQQKVEKRRGSELPETENTYRAETRYHGMAAAAVDDFEENHVEPILKEMEQGNLSLEDVGLYLHARHAPEANARLRKINPTAAEIGGVIRKVKSDRDILKSERATIRKMNPDDYPTNKRYRQTEKETTALQAEIARLENYEPIDDNTALSGMSDAEAISIQRNLEISSKSQYYKKIGELVDKMTKARRELLIESGLETPETIANWEALYEHYVPLMREGKGAVMPRTGRGYDIRGHQKLRAGSEKDVVNILANLVAQHEATIIRAEKAKVGRVFLEFAKNNKGPWKIDTPEQIATYTADGLIAYKDNPAGYFLADNVLSVRVDGEDHHITFDENNENAMKIASALKNLDGGDSGSVVRVLSKVSRFLAMVNTSLNPEFIISNFLRDIQTAGYNMSDSEADKIRMKAIKQVGSAFKGIWQYERNTNRESEWAEWFNRFRHAGGQTGWIQSYENIKDREKDLVNKVKQMQPGKTRLIRRGLTAAFDYIADTNTAVENAIRLSVFKNLVEAGVSESKAAVISKELTVNFNKKGNLGPVMNAAYLFFNASMQGSARIIMAAAKSRKVQKLMVATAGFALMLDIANRLIGGDGDDGEPLYDKIGDWEKERNLIIMLGSGNGYVKIPLPWGYNVFHVFGQAAGEVLTKKHNKVMDSTLRVLGAAVSAFNPMGGEASIMQVLSPTVIDPFVQWIENKDWSGRKLRPSANVFAEKPSSQTYWKSVREPSRIIAEKLNELTGGDEVRPGKIDFSPEAFDLAIDTFTGGTGKFISNLISTPVKLATGDTVETFEVPFLRKVYGKPGKQVLTQEFYKNIDEVRLVSRQINHYKDNPGKVREIVKDYPSEYRLIGRMKATQKTLEEIRKTKQLVTDKIKNEEVKERRLKALNESEEKIMMNFNKQYHRMKEKEK
ncbi:MAG: hypothetical protein A4E71_01778 [Smithella sp. PtaU1.Bin162]|nr:MAG: hypothetical protein A4E71_01778 [Smithella sp. PtaU1.Bin162]